MLLLREKGVMCLSLDLLLREDVYDTFRTRTLLLLQKIKTADREIKGQRIVYITNAPGENDMGRKKANSSSVI